MGGRKGRRKSILLIGSRGRIVVVDGRYLSLLVDCRYGKEMVDFQWSLIYFIGAFLPRDINKTRQTYTAISTKWRTTT